MKKHSIYVHRFPLWAAILLITLAFAACKKDKSEDAPPPPAPLATLGLYQYGNGTSKRVFMPITKIGNQSVAYLTVFDTGSSGFTMDADGVLPASMITSSGLQITGDSVNVNGITVTSRRGTLSYGDLTGLTRIEGNLAYATITLGEASRGSITTKRIPFFIYYKIVNGKGETLAKHSADVFGVGPGNGYNNIPVYSPLNGFNMPANVASGFKLSALSNTSFNASGTYVASLLTIGLVPNDLTSAGFIMHPLNFSNNGGYSANIPATITYNGTSVAAQVLFDTGNPSMSTIETRETNALGQLPPNSQVTITTNRGFTYTYTTSNTSNLTEIQNPNITGDTRSIISIDFFINNLYLTDYTNHQIGLKNK